MQNIIAYFLGLAKYEIFKGKKALRLLYQLYYGSAKSGKITNNTALRGSEGIRRDGHKAASLLALKTGLNCRPRPFYDSRTHTQAPSEVLETVSMSVACV